MAVDIKEIQCEFEGRRFYLKVISSDYDYILEVVPEGFPPGFYMEALAQDTCAIIIDSLRRYASFEKLLNLVQKKPDGTPASLIGAIILHLAENQ